MRDQNQILALRPGLNQVGGYREERKAPRSPYRHPAHLKSPHSSPHHEVEEEGHMPVVAGGVARKEKGEKGDLNGGAEERGGQSS